MSSGNFRKELENLINRESMENASNTPDFILADFMVKCLEAFDSAVALRDTLNGHDPKSGASVIKLEWPPDEVSEP